MFETAFIVRVPEAEAYVGSLRNRFDASVHLGVPAHITILVPFMAPDQINESVFGEIHAALEKIPRFPFILSQVGRFPATAYLVPEPAQPFISLTEALVSKFPAFLPFRGLHESIVPHLTVANGNPAEAAAAASELEAIIESKGSISSFCTSISLIENSSGIWKEMNVFVLPSAAA